MDTLPTVCSNFSESSLKSERKELLLTDARREMLISVSRSIQVRMSRSFKPHARHPYSYRDDPAMPAFPDDCPIIVFDNVCVLCSQFAQFVLRHDKARRVCLVSAQSRLGTALYLHYGLDPANYQTNMLIANGVACFKSEAIMRIAAVLGWPWNLVGAARCLPLAFRDRVYDVVASNRFRWFGRRSTCFAPRPGDARRFLQ